jgi:hypothetical protein
MEKGLTKVSPKVSPVHCRCTLEGDLSSIQEVLNLSKIIKDPEDVPAVCTHCLIIADPDAFESIYRIKLESLNMAKECRKCFIPVQYNGMCIHCDNCDN